MRLNLSTFHCFLCHSFVALGIAAETCISQEKRFIEGFVTDNETTARLAGATLLVNGQPNATSDARGFFRFAVPVEKLDIEARIIGFASAGEWSDAITHYENAMNVIPSDGQPSTSAPTPGETPF